MLSEWRKGKRRRTANAAKAMTAKGIATPNPTFAPVLNPSSSLPAGTLDALGLGLPVTAPAIPVPVELVREEVLDILLEVVVTSFGSVKLKYRDDVVGEVSPSMKIWKKNTRPLVRFLPVPTFHV